MISLKTCWLKRNEYSAFCSIIISVKSQEIRTSIVKFVWQFMQNKSVSTNAINTPPENAHGFQSLYVIALYHPVTMGRWVFCVYAVSSWSFFHRSVKLSQSNILSLGIFIPFFQEIKWHMPPKYDAKMTNFFQTEFFQWHTEVCACAVVCKKHR